MFSLLVFKIAIFSLRGLKSLTFYWNFNFAEYSYTPPHWMASWFSCTIAKPPKLFTTVSCLCHTFQIRSGANGTNWYRRRVSRSRTVELEAKHSPPSLLFHKCAWRVLWLHRRLNLSIFTSYFLVPKVNFLFARKCTLTLQLAYPLVNGNRGEVVRWRIDGFIIPHLHPLYNLWLILAISRYEGWNFNFGNAAVTFDTAHLQSSYFHRPSMYSPKVM